MTTTITFHVAHLAVPYGDRADDETMRLVGRLTALPGVKGCSAAWGTDPDAPPGGPTLRLTCTVQTTDDVVTAWQAIEAAAVNNLGDRHRLSLVSAAAPGTYREPPPPDPGRSGW